MLYFAYGSNMDWDQMRKRCPSDCFVGIARLPDQRNAPLPSEAFFGLIVKGAKDWGLPKIYISGLKKTKVAL